VTGRAHQERAPIYETLAGYAGTGIYGFHTPGHKGGRFAAPELAELVGKSGLALDLPAMTATDNTFHPSGCIRDAQQLAAELFGARATFYLTAGSTLGVAASLLATVPHGRTVALPRNIHRSVVAGLVLSGALPRFVPHDVLPQCGALGVSPLALASSLDTDPRPAAVLLTRPSYYGLTRELEELAAVCHARGVPLIVDEAHGAHLRFLPPGSPLPAIAAGADLVVQSCHKTLGALVGSAQLHVGTESLIEPGSLQDALNVLQTTSPSFLLLASLDLMRRWLWREGERLFAAAVEEAQRLEEQIDAMSGLQVLRPDSDPRLDEHGRDPLRLVVDVSRTGWSGYEVERHLRTEFKIEDEMADSSNVVYVLSPHDDGPARERLLSGLRSVSASPRRGVAAFQQSETEPVVDGAQPHSLWQPPTPPLAMPPRAAALANKVSISLNAAAGRTCAEMVMFYPPGIPLLMPGELVTPETIDVCRQLLAAGAHPYASDPTLETIRVVGGPAPRG
jgi:arginine decarboxylase